jgi:hypothetical protein
MASMKRTKKKALTSGKAMKVKHGLYRGWYYWTVCPASYNWDSKAGWMKPGEDQWHPADANLDHACRLYYESDFHKSMPLHKFIEKMFP